MRSSSSIEGMERHETRRIPVIQHSDARRNLLMNLQVRTFRTRQQANEHLKRIQATFIRPEKVYDPEDPNADSNGHVWVISLSADGSADRLYLCSDGYIR